ncbi:hypothetical protein DFQ28_003008 [Apophysomyces sp. BC1034]|nr:hypothetical protein DFQ30_011378 [Apophysomyces sp. BC1015]KAG0193856.1 hypothetical protein DFQ28_003008 [Apophysomyces sp. BC1034]
MNDFDYPKDTTKNSLCHQQDPFQILSRKHDPSSPTLTTTEPWKNPATNPVSCDLQDVILYYQSQPDLLRLILLSKVEEDKRRAEEAKLKAKELDLLLLQQQQQQQSFTPDSVLSANMVPNMLSHFQERRESADIMMDSCAESNGSPRRDSALGSSFDGGDDFDDRTFSQSPASILHMASFSQPMMTLNGPKSTIEDQLSPPSYTHSFDEHTFQNPIQMEPEHTKEPSRCYPQRPRRRREMQAITKIVETREHPYIDGYFWKNNGNTIQKKTGNKSVYYKCSNSGKGCPVNKTVTWKDNGEYLIKYRGEHLLECGKVQRIIDM